MATASRVHPGLSGILERLEEEEGAGFAAALDPRDGDERDRLAYPLAPDPGGGGSAGR